MALNEKTLLKAKAMKLGVDGFRTMSTDELKAAVKAAEKSTNGADGKKKATAVVKKAAGKKSAPKKTKPEAKSPAKKKVSPPAKPEKATKTKAAPANKSKAQKSSPKKATAAQGKAKRQSSGDGSVVHRTYEGGKVGKGGYTNIDRFGIDWTLESKVGTSGKRKDVLDSLRKHKGDYDAVFVELREHAVEWYPNALKAYPDSKTKVKAAERQLRWLIARVAYDYAYKTSQHQGRANAKQPVKKSTKSDSTKKAAPTKKKTAATKTKSTSKKRASSSKTKTQSSKPWKKKASPKASAKKKAVARAKTKSASKKTSKRGVR